MWSACITEEADMSFLAGFDAQWQDASAYLDTLTRDLWEGRRLDRTPDLMAPQVVSHGGLGWLQEPEVVGADLAARLAAFPDTRLLAEDTLWHAPAENALMAAQRFHVITRHDGAGLYGPATGRDLGFLQMAERYCVAGRVQEEWVLRDEAAILSRLGIGLEEGARWRLVTAPDRSDPPAPRPAGQGNGNPWGQTLGDLIDRVMGGELSALDRQYDPAAELFLPGSVQGCGPREAEAFWIGLRAAFPSALFHVEHLMGAEDPLAPPRATLRWRLAGRHDGHGTFGMPTGAEVDILGMTHAEFGPDGLRREWTLYDTPGIWAQILRATGSY
ncbi:SnoaL-like polyketide cyclase [Salipiger marinus]|uniref:SnoaL-like polyketide cyclase n=2 Tax=Salipiger marinus TaxID=555512 RepID=A0A1G8NLR4_9RHOB|nr:SnoaL-like polyketide cyclase [Salipiger marinus]